MEYYLATDRNQILIYATEWINFRNITTSLRNQILKTTCCTLSFIHSSEMSKMGKYIETGSSFSDCQELGGGWLTTGMGVLPGVMKIFWN